MRKRKIARLGYLLISALFCCAAFAVWLLPEYSPQAAFCVSGTILLGYGVIRIVGFFSDDPYCLAFHYDLACGLLFLVVGAMIWIKGVRGYPYLIPGLGWIALLDSLCKIQMAKEARDFGLRQWRVILPAAILTGISSFLLILDGFPGPRATKILTGCTLLLEGILNWFTVSFAVKKRN